MPPIFAADENFNNDILRALQRRHPSLEIVRIQDAGLSGADDPTVLEWAATQSRILLTHDVATLAHFAYDRIAQGLQMPGVIEVGRSVTVRQAVEDIILIATASEANEWSNCVIYLPLQ